MTNRKDLKSQKSLLGVCSRWVIWSAIWSSGSYSTVTERWNYQTDKVNWWWGRHELLLPPVESIRSQMEAEALHSSAAAWNLRWCCRVTQVETDRVTQAAKSSSVPQTKWLPLDRGNHLSAVHKPALWSAHTQGHFSILRHQGDPVVWQDGRSFAVTTRLQH